MIIAPLMAPILSFSYAIVASDLQLANRSLITVVSGVILVVVLGYAATKMLGLRVAGSEILNRTSPTLLDLGVAMASGAAAAFAYSRRSIMSSIAGVAIAVALVPPLAVTGIGLAQGVAASAEVGESLARLGLEHGGFNIASGSFLLFLTNFFGIILVAGVVFLSQGYGSKLKGILALVLVAVLSIGLLQPLGVSLHRLYVRSHVLSAIAALTETDQDLFMQSKRLFELGVDLRDEVVHVYVALNVSEEMMPKMQSSLDQVRDTLEASLNRPVVIEAQIVRVSVFGYQSGSELPATAE
jgi:uncharacterized hydrophobic protein (TIGR00271 family)